jgi:hypothetical protein
MWLINVEFEFAISDRDSSMKEENAKTKGSTLFLPRNVTEMKYQIITQAEHGSFGLSWSKLICFPVRGLGFTFGDPQKGFIAYESLPSDS